MMGVCIAKEEQAQVRPARQLRRFLRQRYRAANRPGLMEIKARLRAEGIGKCDLDQLPAIASPSICGF